MIARTAVEDAPMTGVATLEGRLVAALDAVLPRVNRAIRLALNQAEGEARLTVTQFHCLRAIATGPGPVTTSRLARRLQVTAPTMTRTVDSLVERGLVERQADPADRRTTSLLLTTDGHDLARRYQAVIDDRLHALIAALAPGQQRRLLAAAGDLTAMLDADEQRERERG
ncbi:MAG: MarR family transcriptional regulator [Chloroflexota bacterium]|nr:MarR family transcriptional regulator [Chloroflexota bacterium]